MSTHIPLAKNSQLAKPDLGMGIFSIYFEGLAIIWQKIWMVNLSLGSSEIVGNQNIVYDHLSVPKTPFLCKRKLKPGDVTYIQITYLYNSSSFF